MTLTLKSTDPGALHLSVKQFGDPTPDTVSAESFSEPATLTALSLHAGDTSATLTGVSLNQVKQLTLGSLTFTPTPPPAEGAPEPSTTTLQLDLPLGTPAPGLKPGEHLTASITLKDGRSLTLPLTVAPPRPAVTLLGKSISTRQNPKPVIQLANPDDLPVDQQITFSLKSAANFPRTGQIEVANADGSLHTALTVANGALVLQNPHTLLATLDPMKSFGTSAFGPLRLRPVSPEGVPGDWLPLATLVRLPTLNSLHCPEEPSRPCTLSGSSLYLLDSVATDTAFTNPTPVPEGFVASTLPMPRPRTPNFYIRLRDDPAAVNPVTLPAISDRTAAPAAAATTDPPPSHI